MWFIGQAWGHTCEQPVWPQQPAPLATTSCQLAAPAVPPSPLPPTRCCLPPPPQVGADGKEILLSPPSGDELPARGFDAGEETYQAPAGATAEVKVSPESQRLQLLAPFDAWSGKDLEVGGDGWVGGCSVGEDGWVAGGPGNDLEV